MRKLVIDAIEAEVKEIKEVISEKEARLQFLLKEIIKQIGVVKCAEHLNVTKTYISKLKNVYRGRAQAMDEALHHHFGDIAQWKRPDGGYFFWISLLDESVDTTPLKDKAGELQTGFQHGSVFSTKGRLSNCMRLCFAHYNEDDIREGIARLRPLFEDALGRLAQPDRV